MRIIAGKWKGRKLTPPSDDAIRPTSDRTREALFNVLMHGQYAGDAIIDQQVVDLCCGTGAVGLEALSRGAKTATFVDRDAQSLALAKQNALHCGALQTSFFVRSDVTSLPAAREAATLVIMDAPYDALLLPAAYRSLKQQGWLAPGALLVAEQRRDAEIPALEDAALIETRLYGKTALHIFRAM